MPLSAKGRKIKRSMIQQYGKKKGERVFWASKNAGRITGVDKGFYGHVNPSQMRTEASIVTSVELE